MGKLHMLLLLLLIHSYTAQRILGDSGGDVCTGKDCGQGNCVATGGFPGFDCLCNPGWTKFFPFPACTLPNCTLNNNCGTGSPPLQLPPLTLPPPLVLPPLSSLLPPIVLPPLPSILPPLPPLPSLLPPLPPLMTIKVSTTFNACIIVWCGPEGTCVPNGLTYYCKCNEGAANLFDSPGVACFKECALGGDCSGVSLSKSNPDEATPNVTNGSTNGRHAAIMLVICFILLSMFI